MPGEPVEDSNMELRPTELTALLIAPNRELAQQFQLAAPEVRAFQVLADSKTYPTEQTLDLRLRQLKPDVVLLDVVSDLEVACGLIQFISSFRPVIHVVCLHTHNDSESILRVCSGQVARSSSARHFFRKPIARQLPG